MEVDTLASAFLIAMESGQSGVSMLKNASLEAVGSHANSGMSGMR